MSLYNGPPRPGAQIPPPLSFLGLLLLGRCCLGAHSLFSLSCRCQRRERGVLVGQCQV